MRLLTHNMLASNVKARQVSPGCLGVASHFSCRFLQDVQNGFPLRIEAQKLETREVEFSAGTRIAWGVFCRARLMRQCRRLPEAHLPEAGVAGATRGGGATLLRAARVWRSRTEA